MASLHQINATFEPQEDRLILNIRSDDDSEIRIWLTRRYTRLLLGILDKLANPKQERAGSREQAVQAFERDALLAGADFQTEYRTGASNHPLGRDPVLVSRIEYRSLEGGDTALALGLPDGRNVNLNLNLNLNRDLMQVLIRLLLEAGKKAEWDLEAPPASTPPPPPPPPPTRPFTEPARPRP